MALSPDQQKAAGARLETPFLIRQVETHLVFGPLSRHFPMVYLFAGMGVVLLGVVWIAATGHSFNGVRFPAPLLLSGPLCAFIAVLQMRKWTLRQQAIAGWIGIKAALGIGAFVIVLVAPVNFAEHQPDAWPDLFLGLIWIPSLEFARKVTPHQAYLTLARLILTLPCIYFGIKSGNWHA